MTKVTQLALKVLKDLKPFSRKIIIAGSIRRRKPDPVDIDIVLIPKHSTRDYYTQHSAWDSIINYFQRNSKVRATGEDLVSGSINGIQVDIYKADFSNWGAMLLYATGSSGHNIGLRVLAKRQSLLLNQYGLWRVRDHRLLASATEQEIYKKLGRPKFKQPWERE